MTETKKRFAYAWIIVISSMLLQAFVFGVASNIHPQFTSYVIAGENFRLSTFSLMFTIGTFVSALVSPFIGKTYKILSIKLIFSIGIIVSMSGIMFLAFSNAYWMFYIGYALGQVGIVAVTGLGSPILINSWFGDKLKGRALGLTYAGGSVGNIILQSLVVQILANPDRGYKFAYFWFSLISLVVGLVITILFIRMPKDNSEILGKDDNAGNNENSEIEVWGYSFKEIIKIKSYWVYSIGFIFVGFYVAGLAMNFATYLNSLKISPATVGAVGSVFALASLLGNVGGGALFDKIGIFKSMIIACILVALSTVSLLFTPAFTVLAFGYAIFKGFSVYSYLSGPSILAGKLFGNKDFASILAITNIFFAIGVSLGNPLYGLSVEIFGFSITWIIVLACVFIAFGCILSAIRTFIKINKEKFPSK